MKHIKKYIQYQKILLQADRWVKANDERLASRCMYHLNRKAWQTRRQVIKSPIYDLKTPLIRHFYERGFCISVRKHVQTLACWHSRDYNEGWEDHCWKCADTGIYAQHTLYQFVFKVKGQTYVWHQPERLIDFLVTITEPGESTYQHSNDDKLEDLTTEQMNLYMAAVYQYLRRQKAKGLPAPPSLKATIWLEWVDLIYRPLRAKWRWEWKPWISKRLDNIKRFWLFVNTGEMPAVEMPEDEIPF